MANSCKYYKEQRQVSYDNGVTWINLEEYRKGSLVESNSSDCSSPSPLAPIYRWYPSGTTCIGLDKWQQSIRQISNDGGTTWINVSPAEYSATTLIEFNSDDCFKFKATYSNGTTYIIPCDDSTSLTSGETHPQGYDYSAMTEAYIGQCVTNIGVYAFSDCTSLTSCTIGSGVTSISGAAFLNCTSLTSITIPDSVTSIGNSTFWNCNSLVSVNIPNDLARIEMNTFYACRSLVSVTIPSSVTFIGNSAFYNCINLQSVTCLGITPPSTQLSFFEGSTCPIYVPAQSVNTYKTTDYWWIYADRIQPIP